MPTGRVQGSGGGRDQTETVSPIHSMLLLSFSSSLGLSPLADHNLPCVALPTLSPSVVFNLCNRTWTSYDLYDAT